MAPRPCRKASRSRRGVKILSRSLGSYSNRLLESISACIIGEDVGRTPEPGLGRVEHTGNEDGSTDDKLETVLKRGAAVVLPGLLVSLDIDGDKSFDSARSTSEPLRAEGRLRGWGSVFRRRPAPDGRLAARLGDPQQRHAGRLEHVLGRLSVRQEEGHRQPQGPLRGRRRQAEQALADRDYVRP